MDELQHLPSRIVTRRGRPYRPETVSVVRALVERTTLRFAEIASRTGIGEATVGIWARRRGWRRPTGAPPPSRTEPEAADGPVRRSRRSTPRRHGPGTRGIARALIEGSRLGLERIGVHLGVATMTLYRWQRDGGWRRPAPPDRPGPRLPRYRTRLGRPYATDAVETVRRLVTTTHLSQAHIARQAGVSQPTVSNWIRARSWVRPAPADACRYAAARRTAPTGDSGNRRGRPYAPETVAAVRELYVETRLPTANIAARLKVSAPTVLRWANRDGWTRPKDPPDPDRRLAKRQRALLYAEWLRE